MFLGVCLFYSGKCDWISLISTEDIEGVKFAGSQMGNVLEDQNTAVFFGPILSYPLHKCLLSGTSQRSKGRASNSALLLFAGRCLSLMKPCSYRQC